MIELSVRSFKMTVVLTAEHLAKLSVSDPIVLFDLGGGVKVPCRLNPKSIRKAQANANATGALVQGRLVVEQGGKLAVVDAGLSVIEPKPVTPEAGTPVADATQAGRLLTGDYDYGTKD